MLSDDDATTVLSYFEEDTRPEQNWLYVWFMIDNGTEWSQLFEFEGDTIKSLPVSVKKKTFIK